MMGADHAPTQVRPLQARQHRQSLLPQTTSVECAASQWRQLAEETDKKPLPEKLRQAYSLREIDKAEDAIREIVALGGLTAQERPVSIHQPMLPTPGELTAVLTISSSDALAS
jgi:hypothetical protein